MKSMDEKKRFEKLTKECSSTEKITRSDLELLFKYDEQLRHLVRCIVQIEHQEHKPKIPSREPDQNEGQKEQANSPLLAVPVQQARPAFEPKQCSEAESLYVELTHQLEFLQTVQADKEASNLLLKKDESQAQALMRLLARSSQWDLIIELWDIFATRCKKLERALTGSERHMLQHSLDCYNLTLNSRQAEIIWPDCPSTFDHQLHTRGTPQGETVITIWLPGLTNAAGKLQKKPLVATQ